MDGARSGPEAPELPPFDPSEIVRHGADAHWQLVRDGRSVARCSLWWTTGPRLAGDRPGIVGHFAAADRDASAALLEHACGVLAKQGCTRAIGPMDGSTWRRYRLLTDRGAEPPFFMEPDNPNDWPAFFESAGFVPLARYYSALCTDLTQVDPRLSRVGPRMEQAGVRIRSIDPARFETELRAIHGLSLVSFRENFLYTPIEEAEFIAQYQSVQPIIRPELVLLAEQVERVELDGLASMTEFSSPAEPDALHAEENRGARRGGEGLVGFLFAAPDLLQAKRGHTIDTIVVKTAAVSPGRQYAGLGSLLVARCHAAALDLGYSRAIHALMHESNESRNVSRHYGRAFRGYALYSRELGRP